MIRFTWMLICFWSLYTPFIQGQELSKDQLHFLTKNAANIGLDSTYSNGDWHVLDTHLKDKSLVLLGEFTHGTGEIFTARNDLIKYLHNQHGFNTILFEAGIGEMAEIELSRADLNPKQMTYGFFRNWQSLEFQELMKYVQSEAIAIAGYDVQKFGRGFQRLLKIVAEDYQIDTTLYVNLEQQFNQVSRKLTNRKTVYDSVYQETSQLIGRYQTLHERLLKEEPKKLSEAFLVSQKTLLNRINYLKYRLQFLKDKDWNARWAARDSCMADNVNWLCQNIFPGEKIIIIGHNFHIARYNEKEAVMGEFLKEQYDSEMYVIGIFGGKGSYRNNRGQEETMEAPDSTHLDIKHIIGNLEGSCNFLDIPKEQTAESNWLFEKITANDTFIDLSSSKQLILSKHYDGILLIDEVSMQKFEDDKK